MPSQYPHQPYNGNPHMHPGEQVLLRIIGQGRWQHPVPRTRQPRAHPGARRQFDSERDGFGDDTRPRWPAVVHHHHHAGSGDGRNLLLDRPRLELGCRMVTYPPRAMPSAKLTCTPDANGYNTGAPTAINYYEWCQDHNKPLQAGAVRRCGRRRSGDAARPESLHERCMVRRQSVSRSQCDDASDRSATGTTPPSGTIGEPSEHGSRLCLHVALAQRARDHHEQHISRRHDDDDARRFP